MTADVSLPEDGELSDGDRETVDILVARLCTEVGVEEAGLPSLTVERTDGSAILRPDSPMFIDELGSRFEVRAVSRNDNGVRTTMKVQVREADQDQERRR